MPTYMTPYVDLPVAVSTYSAGEAFGVKAEFPNLPQHGVIMSVLLIDGDDTPSAVDLDVVFFREDILGTADEAVFAPTDAELLTCVGAIEVDVFKAFGDNGLGIVDNVGMPYWAPSGTLFFQCVTRGAPTPSATSDFKIAIGIVY